MLKKCWGMLIDCLIVNGSSAFELKFNVLFNVLRISKTSGTSALLKRWPLKFSTQSPFLRQSLGSEDGLDAGGASVSC